MSYKSTLLLPKTSHPIRPNIIEMEAKVQANWVGLYEEIRAGRKGSPLKVVHDGPPYANGNIHMGHLFNKVIKDIIVRHSTMDGYDSPFVMGWDCHGLPIEHNVRKRLIAQFDDHERDEALNQRVIRAECATEAMRWVEIQTQQFVRLGLLADWENPYLTLEAGYEESVLTALKKMVQLGFVKRNFKPIAWCTHDQTALAEAELEYPEVVDDTFYVEFPIHQMFPNTAQDFSLVAWTTTPWSLPGNVALAVNPNLEYTLFKMAVESPGLQETKNIAVAAPLVSDFIEIKGRWLDTIATCLGSDLVGMTYRLPIEGNKNGRVVSAGFVSADTGTGVVHIAPSHGLDDYKLALVEGLPLPCPIDDKGAYTEYNHPMLKGQIATTKAVLNTLVFILGDRLWLQGKVRHKYPHCWRCKRPTITRATPQWFIEMDTQADTLRDLALDEIERINWVPEAMKNRIESMVDDRPDWCISRQRQWGIPIPAVQCCFRGEHFLTVDTIDLCIRKGTKWWFQPEDMSEAEGVKCPKCQNSVFTKGGDILDVWFESGASFLKVLPKWVDELILCEGSDQHRGWFQSSLIISVAMGEMNWYAGNSDHNKTIITHGWVVDESGKKFSKSKGAPPVNETLDRFGADVLRLFVASQDHSKDLKINDTMLEAAKEVYFKLNNTFRFMLGNLFDSSLYLVPTGFTPVDLQPVDKWIRSELNDLIDNVQFDYQKFNFVGVYHRLYNFCVVELSNIYFDVIKDRLYADAMDSPSGNAARYTIAHIYRTMTLLFAPILPHTSEIFWSYVRETSVFLEDFPEPDPAEMFGIAQERTWESMLELRNQINAKIEPLRAAKQIKQNEEISVTVHSSLDAGITPEMLREFCKLSEVIFNVQPSDEDIVIKITAHPKCDRCLRFLPDVSEGLCRRCFILVGDQNEHD